MRRSKVSQLPQDILDELNARLVSGGFSGYRELVDWLSSLGYSISRSSLHEHGSSLEAQLDEAMADARRTRALAKAMRDAGEDSDEGEILKAASEIMQDNLLRVSLKVKQDGVEDTEKTAKTLSVISHAFADVGRFDLSRQKWQAQIEEKARAALISDQRKKLDQLAASGEMSVDTVNAVKRAIAEAYGEL